MVFPSVSSLLMLTHCAETGSKNETDDVPIAEHHHMVDHGAKRARRILFVTSCDVKDSPNSIKNWDKVGKVALEEYKLQESF